MKEENEKEIQSEKSEEEEEEKRGRVKELPGEETERRRGRTLPGRVNSCASLRPLAYWQFSRVLLGLRKCGFSQEGASELLFVSAHSETPHPGLQNDRGQAGRPEGRWKEGCVRASPRTLGNSCSLPPSWSREELHSSPDA